MKKIVGIVSLLALGLTAAVTAGLTYAAIYVPASESYTFDGDTEDFSTFSIGHYFHGGTGADAANAFLISNPTELRNLSKMYSQNIITTSYFYKIANDFSWSGAALEPIGTPSNPFNGHFDGDLQSIHGLKIASNQQKVGMFGTIKGASVSNVLLSVPSISCSAGAATNAGFICGQCIDTTSTITSCYVYGGTESIDMKAKMKSENASTTINLLASKGYLLGLAANITLTTSGFIDSISSRAASVTPKAGNPTTITNETKGFRLTGSGIAIS